MSEKIVELRAVVENVEATREAKMIDLGLRRFALSEAVKIASKKGYLNVETVTRTAAAFYDFLNK